MTRKCVHDTCVEFINGLGASVIGFKLTAYVRGVYKPDKTLLFIECGTITLYLLFQVT